MTIWFSNFGGLFAILAFIHFAIDFVLQSHDEAMIKHNTPRIRAKHCLIYTLGFFPIMWLLNFQVWELVVGMNILFWSHYVEDTYVPVFLWAKYIRRPPEMTQPYKDKILDGYISVQPPDAERGFKQFIETTMGKILMVAIDQIIHLTFLFPLVWMALN
jgi:hypothetical protein